jgi:hypothetical protein
VADAPIEALVARADELSRRWLMSMLAARALSQMADVPVEQLAREAPALCTRLVRALGSDADLEQLRRPRTAPQRGAAPAEGEFTLLAPPGSAATLVTDVDALRNVIWQAALDELREPSVAQVIDLSDRLSFVCATLLAVALQRELPPRAGATEQRDPRPATVAERVLYRSPQVSAGGRQAVLIDELDARAPTTARDRGVTRAELDDRAVRARRAGAPGHRQAPPARREPAAAAGRTAPRARPWDTPLNPPDDAGVVRSSVVADSPRAPDDSAGPMRIKRGSGSRADDRA